MKTSRLYQSYNTYPITLGHKPKNEEIRSFFFVRKMSLSTVHKYSSWHASTHQSVKQLFSIPLHMYYVYILASKRNGTLYIGVTNNIVRRTYEHKQKVNESFTKRHSVDKLVRYESIPSILSAIKKEKQLKKWNRQWKINLIEQSNPNWNDLYPGILE